MRLKTIFAILIFSVGINYAGAQINASLFIKDSAKIITKSKSLEASFRIESAGQSPITGDIAIMGEKFAVTTTANSTIYNGTTQWTISPADKEISIFEPTVDEIAQVNPFAIIRSCEKNYNVKVVSSNNSKVKIQLSPKLKESTIKKIVITFVEKTKLPQQMTLTLDDNKEIAIQIFDIKMDSGIKSSRFEVLEKDYPEYELIDLR